MHAGHRFPDILNYSVAQFEAFLAAESVREGESLGLQLTFMAVACQGDKRAIERLQRELTADTRS